MEKNSRYSVLIVDDDKSLGRTLSGILRKAGYQVQWTPSGEQAVRLVRGESERPINAALIDLKLPDMHGLKVLRMLKKIHPEIGAIMITGHADTETAVGALNEGAFAYIQKPYNVDEVKATLARVLERQSLIQKNKKLMERLQEANRNLEEKVKTRTTDLKAANLKLVHTIEKLREADAAKSQFVSMVSHELRTPLTVILGFAETIHKRAGELDKTKVQEYTDIIHEGASRLARLIEDLLNLSRMQQHQIKLEYEKCDLRAIVEGVVVGLKGTKSAQDKRFEISIDEAAREIVSDRDRVEQILFNLLANAVKYSPGEGRIRIEGARKGSTVVISVIDSGPGIPPDQREKIFEPFYRTEDAINMKSPGTGLGLTITKAIVEALGGRIRIEGEQGKGTSCTFILPREGRQNEQGSK